MLARVKRVIGSVSTVSGWLSSIGVYLMIGLVFIDVLLRYFFGSPTNVADIISVYCMLFVTFVGAAWTSRLDKHVSVDLLYDKLSPTAKLWVHAITNIVAEITLIVITWNVIKWIIYTFNSGFTSSGSMGEPMWIPLAAIPIGFVLWTLQYIVEAINGIESVYNHYKKVSSKTQEVSK